eukprot:INCI18084.1.p1 GENE.INCI18084.1~~INCI18084.1.p1  ORF type:complete len:452 (+),score=67.33 INCI18084.1:417-1772(+)
MTTMPRHSPESTPWSWWHGASHVALLAACQLVVADPSLNLDAEYGSQCLFIYDNAECVGSPLTAGCTDLGEADTCYSLKPLNECVLLDAENGIFQNQTCVRWSPIATTTNGTSTTTTTTTTVSTTEAVCQDTTWEEHLGYELWTDAWNFTCADFENYNWCSAVVNYSYNSNERGCTAAQACCVCGGGTTGGNRFIHPDQVTELPEYMQECSNFPYGIELPCPFISAENDAERNCTYTCRNIEQYWCANPMANASGFQEGRLSAREACCICGGGDLPPEPYVVYDTTTCTFFSYNITPDGVSEVFFDEEGLRYRISYSRSNPPACWTGLAFICLGGISLVSMVGFFIQRCIDHKNQTKVSADNLNRLPRQSVMEKTVENRKREQFEAEQKAEEDEEVERQRILRNEEADAWLTKAKKETALTIQAKWQKDQERRNAAARAERAEAKVCNSGW